MEGLVKKTYQCNQSFAPKRQLVVDYSKEPLTLQKLVQKDSAEGDQEPKFSAQDKQLRTIDEDTLEKLRGSY